MTESCSAASALLGEQLAGSSPQAVGWVALEQRGPWGAKAFTASHLDPDLGRAIASLAGQLDHSLAGDLGVTARELVARARHAGRRWDDIATLLVQFGAVPGGTPPR